MPSRAMYELKISGLLSGLKTDNTAQSQAFLDRFPMNPPPVVPAIALAINWIASTGPWPAGFLLPGYEIARWDSVIEEWPRERVGLKQDPGSERTTALTFHAQVTRTVPGPLFENREIMLKEVDWFYNYCLRPWHQDLRIKVKALNDALAGSGRVLSAVDFRDWKWYCGNGGGS